jgi:hypothetical protein
MPEPVDPRQILLVSRTEPLARAAVDALRERHAVEEAHSLQEARDWLARNRADLALVEVDLRELATGAASERLLDVVDDREGAPKVLGLVRCQHDVPMSVLFEQSVLMNFIGADGELDPQELSVTVAKLCGQDIFGVEQYLGPDARWQEYQVTHSEQRQDLIDTAETFAEEAGCHKRVASRVSLAADELLTNAIYNAPVDAQGQSRFGSRPRSEPVTLDEGEVIRFRLGTDGKRLAVATSDPFGSLSPETVLRYLTKCFHQGDDQIDTKPGGAGLGLYSLFNLLHHFVININPGRRTEAMALVDVTRSYREFASRSKSLNIFVARTPLR